MANTEKVCTMLMLVLLILDWTKRDFKNTHFVTVHEAKKEFKCDIFDATFCCKGKLKIMLFLVSVLAIFYLLQIGFFEPSFAAAAVGMSNLQNYALMLCIRCMHVVFLSVPVIYKESSIY